MRFGAIVGNPPYQKTRRGTSHDKPIYNLFMDSAFNVSDKVTLITPARFLFNAGATPKDWNSKILNDTHFKVAYYAAKSADVFTDVKIKGGVVVTYRDLKTSFGKVGIYYAFPELNRIKDKVWSIATQSLSDIIPKGGRYKYSDLAYKEQQEEMKKTPDRRISTSAFDRIPKLFTEEKPRDGFEYIRILGLHNNMRVYKWFKKDYLLKINDLYKYKVMLPKANGSGEIGEVLSTPIIGEPINVGIAHTSSFISIGTYDTLFEAEAAMKYVKSKFARCMLGILKVTQDNTKKVWKFVPMQDFAPDSDIDWSKSVAEIDQQLYKKYNLSEDEVAFIEEKIKPME